MSTDKRGYESNEALEMSFLIRDHPRVSAANSRARRQAAKAPDCKSGIREFESHRALQIKDVL
jgi:hypothetical protein